MRRRAVVAAALLSLLGPLALAGCGRSDTSGSEGRAVDAADWSSVLAAAKGQTVHWYLYGGDTRLNAFVADVVAPRLARLGVTLDAVRVEDTGEAVNKVLGERQAGRTTGGSVDAIWINGENFATGVQADLWWCGWADELPHHRYVDADDPAVRTDFGVPVRGCESVWQRASSALVYDGDDLSGPDVRSVAALLAWARSHPGRLTYPAPPDFTGSMAVRSLLYAYLGGPQRLVGGATTDTVDEARYRRLTTPFFARLRQIEPALWRGGSTYPTSQDQVEQLYADGVISAYFTYGPGAVAGKVADGTFPASTRQAVPASGNIANDSFVTIPRNAAHRAGALVLADLLQDPQVQLALYRAEGAFPGIDLSRTPPSVQEAFARVQQGPSVLSLQELDARSQPELPSAYITRIEDDWRRLVLGAGGS